MKKRRAGGFVFIHAHARIFHVTTMCRVLEVSRAGFYKWRAQPVSERAVAPTRYRVTTQSGHREPVAPNRLARRFGVRAHAGPNAVWAADITYIPTRDGWLYLAVILDLASRRVVGWAVRSGWIRSWRSVRCGWALRHRRAQGGMHHSDRGVQYASAAYRALLAAAQFTQSMSRVGDCWDNAVVESFFATLTKELLVAGVFESRAIASRELFEFIEIWYDRQRRHSSLGYRSPVQFEKELQKVS